MATKSIQIHFNAPSNMKRAFDNVLKQAGVNVNDAYRIFMQQTINHNGLPFAVKAKPKDHYTIVNNPHFSNQTAKAIKEDIKHKGDHINLDQTLRDFLNE